MKKTQPHTTLISKYGQELTDIRSTPPGGLGHWFNGGK